MGSWASDCDSATGMDPIVIVRGADPEWREKGTKGEAGRREAPGGIPIAWREEVAASEMSEAAGSWQG